MASAAEHEAHRLGECGQEPTRPNQIMLATGKKAENTPSPVQHMFGGSAATPSSRLSG